MFSLSADIFYCEDISAFFLPGCLLRYSAPLSREGLIVHQRVAAELHHHVPALPAPVR